MEAIFGEFIWGWIELIAWSKIRTSTITSTGYKFVIVKWLNTFSAYVPDHTHCLHFRDYLVGDLTHLDLCPVKNHIIQSLYWKWFPLDESGLDSHHFFKVVHDFFAIIHTGETMIDIRLELLLDKISHQQVIQATIASDQTVNCIQVILTPSLWLC